jgi:hypothetical protein
MVACGSQPAAERGEPQDLQTRKTPEEGTVIFRDPRERLARGGRRRPTLITVTTEAQKGKRPDEPSTSAGTVTRDSGESQSKADLRRLLEGGGSSVVVTQERFRTLWRALEEAGVFKLPRYRGGIPPEDQPYLSVSAEGRTWIFLHPARAQERDLPRGAEEQARVKRAWNNSWASATILMVEVLQ